MVDSGYGLYNHIVVQLLTISDCSHHSVLRHSIPFLNRRLLHHWSQLLVLRNSNIPHAAQADHPRLCRSALDTNLRDEGQQSRDYCPRHHIHRHHSRRSIHLHEDAED